MDIELILHRGCQVATTALILAGVLSVPATHAQDDLHKEKVLILNAEEENRSCLYPVTLGDHGLPHKPDSKSTCPYTDGDNRELFLRQGKRTELRVFNRKFLTDYSITIDAVTTIQTLPEIRGLNEAQNLSLGPATLLSPPATKGGTEGISARTTVQILYQLLDEGMSSKPKADLDAERAVLDRERERINAEFRAFRESYRLLAGPLDPPPPAIPPKVTAKDCEGVTGAPDAKTLIGCLERELDTDSQAPDWDHAPYSNEDGFRRTVLRVQDLIAAVKAIGAELAASDLPTKEQKIEADVSQYENDAVTFEANVQASKDAVRLARQLATSSFRKELRREQLKAFLTQQLKTGQAATTPNPQDEADMNELLDLYEQNVRDRRLGDETLPLLRERWDALLCSAGAMPGCSKPIPATDFPRAVAEIRDDLGVELSGLISKVNRAQSTLLNRVNAIYDHSEVPDALVKNIDISGHSGNLIVYYTIRRIETFTRFTISAVPAVVGINTQNAGGPNPNGAPPPKGSPPPDTQPGPAPATQDKSDQQPGIVVSKGSFEVHSFFHFNVAAAFAYSSLKDQSIGQQPTPLGCNGTPTTPDASCFTPVLNGGSNQIQPIILFDYYIHERDTFPRDKFPYSISKRWPCAVDFWQCIGPTGGLSLISANNYYLGGFFEPILGVQFSGGANFGSEKTLQKSYQFGVPVDITGNFPTYDRRATGWFLSAGLDLGLFRKVFGKVMGLGTATSTTQGN
jgi:hypothetical protein